MEKPVLNGIDQALEKASERLCLFHELFGGLNSGVKLSESATCSLSAVMEEVYNLVCTARETLLDNTPD